MTDIQRILVVFDDRLNDLEAVIMIRANILSWYWCEYCFQTDPV